MHSFLALYMASELIPTTCRFHRALVNYAISYRIIWGYEYYIMNFKKGAFQKLEILNRLIEVEVKNVKVNGIKKDFKYSFTIFDPNEVN
jgi:hypothetical protein